MARPSPNVSRTPTLLHTGERTTQLIDGRVAAQNSDLLRECVLLFNRHYGVWGPSGPRPGELVRISVDHIQSLLLCEQSSLSIVRVSGELAGYCVVVRFDVPGRGKVHWVSQLVVAEAYRNLRFATELLFSAWNFSGAYAWGLATVNPYAVRALETTTRRHCQRRLIVERGDEMCSVLHGLVPYIPPALARDSAGNGIAAVDTGFFIDHSDIESMKDNASRHNRPWGLGRELDEGNEWLAAVFGDQPPADIDADRLEHLLTASDDTWKSAYARMSLDDNHRWMQHTTDEADLLAGHMPMAGTAVDVGCGIGRHAAALTSRGAGSVLAIDIVPEMIARAIERNPSAGVHYRVADVRVERGNSDTDLVYALYDVLGSSTAPGDDLLALEGMYSYLKPGGSLVISVMNAEPMLASNHLRRATDEGTLVTLLESLPSSDAMETTGSVFDPVNCLEFQGVFFRKETFTAPGDLLPAEIIVRDRRFTAAQIRSLVEQAGFTVESVLPVQAGEWRRTPALDATDTRAKELLVVARRPA